MLTRFELHQIGRDLLVNKIGGTVLLPARWRWRLLRALGMREVEPCLINPGGWFGSRDVRIGRGSFLNYGVQVDGPVTIGARCNIGFQVLFCTSSHAPGTRARRAGAFTQTPIVVGDGCWIGARTTILPGVTLGDGCVVAAGSVVTTDCAPHTLYAGVPAVAKRAAAS